MPDQKISVFSKNRFNGETVPDDVRILLEHSDELKARTGVELNWEPDWFPWLDTSYLNEADRENTDIMANVRAIHKVCSYIFFFAVDEESQYFGYWRGINHLPIERCPIVFLDNEGQFRLCSGGNFAEAVWEKEAEWCRNEAELGDWMRSIGIRLPTGEPGDLPAPKNDDSPAKLHNELYCLNRG